MGLNKPIIISTSAVDTSNLATKSDMTTLQNSVTSALANVGGAVKHIQRGTVAYTTSATVTLSGFTNLEKMSVRIHGTSWAKLQISGGYAYPSSDPYVNTLSLTSLVLRACDTGGNMEATISYEVIEFY